MLPAARSVRPGGAGEGESATAWTGEKRRKTTTCPPPLGSCDVDAGALDDQPQVGTVFSAQDDIPDEELAPYLRKVRSRDIHSILQDAPYIRCQEEIDKLYNRFCQLRLRDYHKMSKPGNIGTAPTDCNHPPSILDWDDPCRPDRMFDWTVVDPDFFVLADLTDYQRLIPTRNGLYEYGDWENYRLTFSSYETDEDYVKYCDELSKRIKWVEEHQHLDDREFSKVVKRGFKQAMKIAAEFSHLPHSLADRGYKEYIWCLRHVKAGKDYGHLYCEIWKRVTKQKMSFTQALEEIHAENICPKHNPVIEAEIRGVICALITQYKICMANIPKHVEVDDERITWVASTLLKPNMYVDFVKKKLEIGRRLNLTPSQ